MQARRFLSRVFLVAISTSIVAAGYWFRTDRGAATAPPLLMAAQELPGGAKIQSAAYGHETRQDDWPALAQAPDGSVWAAWLSFEGRRDDVAIRHYRDGKWQNMLWVPGTSGDSWMPQVAVDRENRVWVVWSQQARGNWDICARRFDPARQEWSKLGRLSTDPLPDIHPRLAADGKGRFAVVWQGFREKNSNILLAVFDGEKWTPEIRVTREARNDWFPAVAFDSRGAAWVVYDSYRNGNYNVMLASVRNGAVESAEMIVSDGPANDLHATVAVDAMDRVWVAWEAAPPNWGKDVGYVFRSTATGAPLGGARELRLRCRVSGEWREPSASLQAAFTGIASQPHVFFDGRGSVWVIAKVRPANGTAYWEYQAAHLEGATWSRAFALPNSRGRSSTRAAGLAARSGQLWLAWPTDNREAPRWPRPRRQQVYAGTLDPPSSSPEPAWRDRPAEEKAAAAAPHRDEAADIRALRAYGTTIGGKRARLLRGDFHRHTELSWDGAGIQDGSLTDFYRYMLDAAALDYGATTDHQAGAWPYWQWYTEKMTDMFHVPGAYVAIYGYERSPQWPKGNRNIFWAKRSDIRITPLYMKDGATGYSLPPTPMGDESGVGMRESPVNDTALLYEDVRATSGLTI